MVNVLIISCNLNYQDQLQILNKIYKAAYKYIKLKDKCNKKNFIKILCNINSKHENI